MTEYAVHIRTPDGIFHTVTIGSYSKAFFLMRTAHRSGYDATMNITRNHAMYIA